MRNENRNKVENIRENFWEIWTYSAVRKWPHFKGSKFSRSGPSFGVILLWIWAYCDCTDYVMASLIVSLDLVSALDCLSLDTLLMMTIRSIFLLRGFLLHNILCSLKIPPTSTPSSPSTSLTHPTRKNRTSIYFTCLNSILKNFFRKGILRFLKQNFPSVQYSGRTFLRV